MQLLEGKASFLKGCGITVTMPSAEAMAQASPDIIDRIQAIKEVNLSGMENLAGEFMCTIWALLLCYRVGCDWHGH